MPKSSPPSSLRAAAARSTACLFLALLSACGGGGGSGGEGGTISPQTLIATQAEPAGTNCVSGGTRVTSGVDANADGVLGADEISQTRYVCGGTIAGGETGAPGPAGGGSLILLTAEPPGANCPAGGTRVDAGGDANGNGTLDVPAEVGTTAYVCNDVPGDPRAWQRSALISADYAAVGDTAFDADGNALAVWAQSSGAIWSARYTPATGWNVPVRIGTGAPGAINVSVRFDAAGNAIATWNQSSAQYDVWVNRYVAGAGWGTAELLAAGAGGFSTIVGTLGVAANGNVFVPWTQVVGTGERNVWVRRYTAAGGWDAAQQVYAVPGWRADSLQVAVDATGSATLVWTARDVNNGARSDVLASRYTPGGGWSAPQPIENDDTGPASSTRVAVDGAGVVHVVWQQSDGIRFNAYTTRYTPGVGWSPAPQLLENADTGNVSDIRVAANTAGEAVATWVQSSDVWASRYLPGTGWGAPQRLDTRSAGIAKSPEAAIDGAGNAIVVWSQSDGVRISVWASRFTPAGGWGSAQLLEADPTADAYHQNVALDGQGNAITLWFRLDGTSYSLWSAEFR